MIQDLQKIWGPVALSVDRSRDWAKCEVSCILCGAPVRGGDDDEGTIEANCKLGFCWQVNWLIMPIQNFLLKAEGVDRKPYQPTEFIRIHRMFLNVWDYYKYNSCGKVWERHLKSALGKTPTKDDIFLRTDQSKVVFDEWLEKGCP